MPHQAEHRRSSNTQRPHLQIAIFSCRVERLRSARKSKGKYFGELTPVGPYNLINWVGAVGLSLTAVYGVGGNIVRSSDSGPGNTTNARFVGTQLEFVAEWIPAREWAFLVSYSHSVPGSFIRDTGPSETIHFFAAGAVFQF